MIVSIGRQALHCLTRTAREATPLYRLFSIYDGYGNLKGSYETRGGQGRLTSYEYDKRNRLTKVTADDNGAQETSTFYSYDPVGNLVLKIEDYDAVQTDRVNAITVYTYDNLDRQIVESRYRNGSDSLPLQTFTTYDAAGNVLATIESTRDDVGGTIREHKATTRFTYDAVNRLSSTTVDDNVTWQVLSNSVNITGDTLSVRLNKDSGGFVIADAIRIDRLGTNGEILDTRIIDDDASGSDPRFTLVSTSHWNSSNHAQTEFGGDVTALNISTSAAWTFTGLEPGNYRVYATWVYDPSTLVDSIANYDIFKGAVGAGAALPATANHRVPPVGITGSTTTFTYDAVGNLIAQTNPLGHVTSSEYDRLNRLVKTTAPDPDNNFATDNTPSTTYVYDAIGQLLSESNGEGEVRTFGYDALGNLIRETDGEGHTTISVYDSEGNLLSYTDPEGYETTYTYDRLNRLKTDTIVLGALSATRSYTYKAQGNLSEQVDRNGRKSTFLYDRLDRKTTENWLNGSNDIIGTQEWDYDHLGRIWFSRDATNGGESILHTVYDDLGRVIAERNYHEAYVTTAPMIEQRYEYDLLNVDDWQQYVRSEYSQHLFDGTDFTEIGTTVTLVDKLGRTARIEDTLAGEATKRIEFSYDASSQQIGLTRTSGSFFFDTRYEYDNAGRVTEIEHYRDDDATPFSSYGYEYDKANRISELTTTQDTSIAALSALTASVTEDFSFDNSGQLTGNNSSVNAQDEAFQYDGNGNRTGTGLVIGDFNRLLQDADWIYEYDHEGNLIRKDSKTSTAYTEYDYDHDNRLIFVKRFDSAFSNGFNDVTYRYNADDELVSRHENYWHYSSILSYDNDEYFVNAGGQRVLSFIYDLSLHHRLTWAPGFDQLLSDEVYNYTTATTDTLWAASDHLGTVHNLVDNNETVVEHREYDSFGALEAVYNELGNSLVLKQNTFNQTDLQSHYGFAGKNWDLSADLYFNNARWYDPATGRFLSEDPTGFADGPNPYRYAGNDPVNFSDPTGLSQAGNPLNNLFGGGYAGGVTKEENPAFRNPVSTFKPVVSMNDLFREFNGPARTPSARDVTLYDPLPSARTNLLEPFGGPVNKGPGQALGLLDRDSREFPLEPVHRVPTPTTRFDGSPVPSINAITPYEADMGRLRYLQHENDNFRLISGTPEAREYERLQLSTAGPLERFNIVVGAFAGFAGGYQVSPGTLNVYETPAQVRAQTAPRNQAGPAGFSTPAKGDQVHQGFKAALVEQTGTRARDWIVRTTKGQTGVDATYIGPKDTYPGFKHAELKPYSQNGYDVFQHQLNSWNHPVSQTQLWWYNKNGVIGSSGLNY